MPPDYQVAHREENQLLLGIAVAVLVLCSLCGIAIGSIIEHMWAGFVLGFVLGMVMVALLWIAKSLQQAGEAAGGEPDAAERSTPVR